MRDLPIFLIMFGEMNYESIMEDFTKSSSSSNLGGSSTNAIARSKS